MTVEHTQVLHGHLDARRIAIHEEKGVKLLERVVYRQSRSDIAPTSQAHHRAERLREGIPDYRDHPIGTHGDEWIGDRVVTAEYDEVRLSLLDDHVDLTDDARSLLDPDDIGALTSDAECRLGQHIDPCTSRDVVEDDR